MKKTVKISCILIQVILLSLNIYANWPPENVYLKKEGAINKIALTFDDGPHPVQTPEILDILNDFNIKATFFVLGKSAEEHPEIIRRILAEGHEIGNHTYSHMSLKNRGDTEIVNEIYGMERALEEIAEIKPHLFRPPGGYTEKSMVDLINSLDYEVVLWSIDTKDWLSTPAEEIVKIVMLNAGDGDIVLFHDSIPHGSHTPEALRKILPQLIEKGFEFEKVSDLIFS